MSIQSTGAGHTSKWVRNGTLAKYLNISGMTLWRWKRGDPETGSDPARNDRGMGNITSPFPAVHFRRSGLTTNGVRA